jgi:hypothetical protein
MENIMPTTFLTPHHLIEYREQVQSFGQWSARVLMTVKRPIFSKRPKTLLH